VTWLDILVVAWTCEARFVSRADLREWPLVGPFSRLGGTLWIDRSRRRDAHRAAGDVESALRDGARVVAFLEGGVGDGTDVRPFRSSLLEGAVATGVPCAAAAIVYSLPAGAAGDVRRDVVWSEDEPFARHALRLLSLRRIDAVVRFGPPRTGTDRKALARALEDDARQRR
jgi:1-acyl-sn-glycerol-3-phosphate acyltransferase